MENVFFVELEEKMFPAFYQKGKNVEHFQLLINWSLELATICLAYSLDICVLHEFDF